MADPLTINLVDKVREARRNVVRLAEEMAAAAKDHVTAKQAWQDACKARNLLETELNMAIEERHPEQPLKGGDA